jgi:hypothetical protein
MTNDVAGRLHGPELELPPWLPAEFLDVRFVDGLVLRALVCRVEPGPWEWSVTSISDRDTGQLICSGTTGSVAEARRIAVSEIRKCLLSPIVTPEFAR